MQEDPAVRRKRLKYRSWHRGTKELDLVIGGFAEAHLDGMSEAEIDMFEAIINENEFDIYNWLARHLEVPARHRNPVMELLLAYRLSAAK